MHSQGLHWRRLKIVEHRIPEPLLVSPNISEQFHISKQIIQISEQFKAPIYYQSISQISSINFRISAVLTMLPNRSKRLQTSPTDATSNPVDRKSHLEPERASRRFRVRNSTERQIVVVVCVLLVDAAELALFHVNDGILTRHVANERGLLERRCELS